MYFLQFINQTSTIYDIPFSLGEYTSQELILSNFNL
jgi:hypothetical protein